MVIMPESSELDNLLMTIQETERNIEMISQQILELERERDEMLRTLEDLYQELDEYDAMGAGK